MPRQVTPEQIVQQVRDGLKITLTVGAARECIGDDHEWLGRLQDGLRIPTAIYHTTGDPSVITEAVQDVMGSGWSPPGEWAAYIKAAESLAGFTPGQSG